MPARLKTRKIKSATIVETIIAMLILMISFSAGMIIYNKALAWGLNDQVMGAEMETEFIADSLARTGTFENLQLIRVNRTYQIRYIQSELYPGLIRMQVICRDNSQKQLADINRLIEINEVP